ncbi:MAG: aldo/keto reductase [Gammaproteobacteria bacterium]|jgi:aryl-alcohol dehydrogenase-like predicted oxidoreductase
MKYRKLGHSELMVSEVCLGSMTWGMQNSQKEAFAQIDHALAQGINFVDTAELYAVPPSEDTYGKTEQIIGNWIAQNSQRREEVILASKIVGNGLPWIRGGSKISGETIKEALDASLKRLQTDYIDLYQLHWPNRSYPHFGRHWPHSIDYTSINVAQEQAEHLQILSALDECVQAGKIRYCGLSNDTPWGIHEYIRLAEAHNLPRMVSIQNEFSLLHLMADAPHIIETCIMNDIAYLPWSPLGGGVLSGKYRHGARPEGSRWNINQRLGLFRDTPQVHAMIEALYLVASQNNLSLTEMSLAYVNQYPGVTSTIVGATTVGQLEENIKAFNVHLSESVITQINDVIKAYPMPF